MRILVVCGAGASSTFVALRLRRTFAADPDVTTVTAAAVTGIPHDLGPDDVILLGPHLADRLDDLRAASSPARVIALPEDVFGDLEGSRTRDFVRAALAGTTDTTPTSLTDADASAGKDTP